MTSYGEVVNTQVETLRSRKSVYSKMCFAVLSEFCAHFFVLHAYRLGEKNPVIGASRILFASFARSFLARSLRFCEPDRPLPNIVQKFLQDKDLSRAGMVSVKSQPSIAQTNKFRPDCWDVPPRVGRSAHIYS